MRGHFSLFSLANTAPAVVFNAEAVLDLQIGHCQVADRFFVRSLFANKEQPRLAMFIGLHELKNLKSEVGTRGLKASQRFDRPSKRYVDRTANMRQIAVAAQVPKHIQVCFPGSVPAIRGNLSHPNIPTNFSNR